ncbi:pseudouridine synthase [Paenibacillus sediminis]|uniref:Pseudouridine synthase n=1 Tax=Paenibacillus sediminis TaxID=664909 RepID=A0ABS4H5B4_9BACL|nr:pseudouridine synthase [Paenibacillus sediminis]MBP1937724.1 16S rRNA pseudouridine516 synthase [Paenibacillus sediminis]
MSGSGRKTQRLDKILGHLGYGSRSDIKKSVKQGAVLVNGKVVKDSGIQVDPYQDVIEFGGDTIRYREYVYFMLHKPQGVVSATEDLRDRTVLDLLAPDDRVFDPFPVGRLDKDTEGLLLLTNDGQLAHDLLSPRKHVPKTYFAHVAGDVGEADIEQFAKGVTLDDGYVTMPAELIVKEKQQRQGQVISHILLTIHEGKFHQVKRMFESVDKKVVYLKRMSMGPLQLDESLPLGEYRELTEEELLSLQRANQGKTNL